ncbi:MAG: hypothetical protein ACJA0C_000329 [Candidatus Endobugula sp.]|jgi:hypothetical protein
MNAKKPTNKSETNLFVGAFALLNSKNIELTSWLYKKCLESRLQPKKTERLYVFWLHLELTSGEV